jgi:uncharacterized membrane protein
MRLLQRLTTPAYLAVVVALGALIRFYHIAHASIWHDEGYTMMLAPMGIIEILARTGRDVHPPLYYLALHGWLELFGTSELAARSLSAICLLAAIPVAYLLVQRLYNDNVARVAALFVAIGPFLVRYSQEARMYGLVALLVLASTYALVRALERNGRRWWIIYAITLAAALYTHYYAVFIILVHWLYVAAQTNRTKRKGLFNPWWWGANVGAAGLFLPWLPTALAQFSRVQQSFWIPPVSATTLPDTVLQLSLFYNLPMMPVWIKVAIALGFAGLVLGLWLAGRKYRSSTLLLSAYSLLPPLVVVVLSVNRPIYVDRYFVFAAVAFYMLLAAILVVGPVFARRPRLQMGALIALIVVFAVGNLSVYGQAAHQMRATGQVVNSGFEVGDAVVSGELYTFFDFSYYNQTGTQLRLLAPDGVNGYGESSLIYDRADQIIVHSLGELRPASGRVWLVGKTGQHDYYDQAPVSWTPIGPKQEHGYTAVQLYRVR